MRGLWIRLDALFGLSTKSWLARSTSANLRQILCFVCMAVLAPVICRAEEPLTPIIGLSTDHLDFGIQSLGSPVYRNVELFNSVQDSLSILNVTGILVQGASFGLFSPPDSVQIAGDGSVVTLAVKFQSVSEEPANGSVIITADAPNSPYVVELTGSGVLDDGAFLMGFGDDGSPILCGTQQDGDGAVPPRGTMRAWECLPAVIRADGIQSFIVRVDVGGPVTSVVLASLGPKIVPVLPGLPPFQLTDSNGDFVFESQAFRFNTQQTMQPTYQGDPNAPAGIDLTQVGDLIVEESDHNLWEFGVDPQVNLLNPSVPLAIITDPSDPDIISSDHIVNMRTSTRAVGTFLVDGAAQGLRSIAMDMYDTFPDNADFLTFIPTYFMKPIQGQTLGGRHLVVQRNFSGAGEGTMFDASSQWGSSGLLLGALAINSGPSSTNTQVLVHEFMHQWAAYFNSSLNLSNGHYFLSTSVKSILASSGASRTWINNGNGSFSIQCEALRVAPPLDRYLMGLVNGTDVQDLYYLDMGPGPPPPCPSTITGVSTTTIQDIQAVHGVRYPGPLTSDKTFTLGFVIEAINGC